MAEGLPIVFPTPFSDFLGGNDFSFSMDEQEAQPHQPAEQPLYPVASASDPPNAASSSAAGPATDRSDMDEGIDSPRSSHDWAPQAILRSEGRRISQTVDAKTTQRVSSGSYYQPAAIADLSSRKGMIAAGYYPAKFLDFTTALVLTRLYHLVEQAEQYPCRAQTAQYFEY